MVRELASRNDLLMLPVKWHNRPTVAAMLSDVPNKTLIGVIDDADATRWADRCEQYGTVLRLGVHNKRELLSLPAWDKQLYRQANVPFEYRWSKFSIPVRNVLSHNTDPFLHEDIERGFVIDRSHVPEGTVPVARTGTMLESVPWLSSASEIHCIDSAWLCMADSIPTAATRLVMHRYARKNSLPPTLTKNWEIIECRKQSPAK